MADTSSGYPAGIDSFTSGVTSLDAATDSLNALNASASSGGVALDPATGESLLKALNAHLDEIDRWLERVSPLSARLPLGANPVSNEMTDLFSRRALNSEQAYGVVLARYRAAVRATADAVNTAISNTQALDADHADKYATKFQNL